MVSLLLDSSNKYLAVGISQNGKVIDRIYYEAWQRQSELMVGEIDNILSRNKLTRSDIGAVVVGIGPGSYTGVRIAITIAKTIAYALKIKVYAISSLSLLKDRKKPTICVFNARSGRSYFAVYEGDTCLEKECVKVNDEVFEYYSEHPSCALNGDVKHLGKDSGEYDLIQNLADSEKDVYMVKDVFLLNPLYLKDLLG